MKTINHSNSMLGGFRSSRLPICRMLSAFVLVISCLGSVGNVCTAESIRQTQDQASKSDQTDQKKHATEPEKGSISGSVQQEAIGDTKQVGEAIEKINELEEVKQIQVNGRRIAQNFFTLASNNWSDVAMEAGQMVATSLLWTIAFGILGMILAIVLYLVLLKFGWASFKWRYFWTVGWIIPVVFVLSFSIGFAYSGGFYGFRSYCVHAIKEDRMIERVSMTMYCAIIMDQNEYEMKGEEKIAELTDVFDNAEKYQLEFNDEFREMLKEQVGGNGEDRQWHERMALDLGVEVVDGRIGKWVKENGVDVRVLILAFMDQKKAEKKFGKLTVKQALAAAAPLFKNAHKLSIGWLDVILLPNIYFGIIVGVLIPLGGLLLIHLIVWLVRWIQSQFQSDEQPPSSTFEKEKALLQ